MTGGFPRPVRRLPIVAPGPFGPLDSPDLFRLFRLLCAVAALLALAALSGCSALLWGTQQAPIVEATVMPVEPASAPVAASAPEPVETEANEGPEQKKPKKPAVKPHKVEPPPPVVAPAPPPPPPPPPLIVLRTIERSDARTLLDSQVQKPDGKVVGRAIDMTADAAGKPREMVVNLLGFLGVGDRKVNFPWGTFHFTPTAKGAPITLNATAVPSTTTKSNVPELALLDATVERANGAKVGRVVDVLIDANAQPQAIVLDVSGMVSTDRRTIAANWSALRFVTRDKELHPQLDLSDAQINATPPYATGKPIRAVSPAPPAAPPAASAATAASAPPTASTALPVSNARAVR
ncbi:PRC-barrel domain-containing protein [Paraburkholderia sp. MMS20-SJTN17]|uniref:PRC-barrel domain-containing protein n=1 Tax=Paraburkholderia translucens TaxID=2886945 RepID=A0ABS8KAF0_9BURK|nr:PRC-barrel domain-containing protein [Paraburkholderia sp. MMS20-SJTN17]MCC8401459.1 PRC-barrel domain-containing protein [Paraburkholderia sp. MMS20-SJTN17]